jgi:RNA binding exosome subunit
LGAIKLSETICEALKSNRYLTALDLYGNRLVAIDFSLKIQQIQLMWEEIHDRTRTNDLQQLMTLLSKHSINLNSFYLSKDKDTILHSAAKSNNVNMIEFVLQRISPNVKQQMMKMRNNQKKLVADFLTTWTPSTHSLFPLKFRQVVKAVLMLGAKRQDGTPYYPQTHFYKLPKDVLFLILQHCFYSWTNKRN